MTTETLDALRPYCFYLRPEAGVARCIEHPTADPNATCVMLTGGYCRNWNQELWNQLQGMSGCSGSVIERPFSEVVH